MTESFDELARALGIAAGYRHAGGHEVAVAPEVRAALAAAMGYCADTPAALADSLARLTRRRWRSGLAAVAVAWADAAAALPSVALVRRDGSGGRLRFTLTRDDGAVEPFERTADDLPVEASAEVDGERRLLCRVPLPGAPPPGVHRVTCDDIESAGDGLTLIVAPPRAWAPARFAEDRGRVWGFATQLYGLAGGEGVGTGHGGFGELEQVVAEAAALGADVIGLNPLHALFPNRPTRRCPYAPSSRLFLNPLYLDLARLPEWLDDPALAARLAEPRQRAALDRLARGERVDHAGVAAQVWPLLRQAFDAFCARHLARHTAEAAAFRRFQSDGGAALEAFGRYEAIADHQRAADPDSAGTNWQVWPAALRDPDRPEVAAFVRDHRTEIDFRAFLQWLLDRQLAQAAASARARGLAIGLYRDIAVGFDRDGADAWMSQALVPTGVSIGCPPDLRNPMGQDWGVAGFDPLRLEDRGVAPWHDLVCANMRHAGAVRIDHAFQLTRQYWVPHGRPPTEGGYVRFPLEPLLALLCLESHRRRCVVVTEDLGTIPDGFRERMMAAGALSYRILHRERGPERSYLPPTAYPAMATVALGTHDQATLTGFWTGRDVAARGRLGLYPSPDSEAAAVRDRPRDRCRLVAALTALGVLDGPAEGAEDGLPTEALVLAVHRFLAATPCRMILVQLDDVLGVRDQVNLPATVDAYPNWTQRTPIAVERIAVHPLVRRVAAAFGPLPGARRSG